MTAAQKLCNQVGLSMKEVCKRAQISQNRFETYARSGGMPFVSSERLCSVLGDAVDPLIFVWGYRRWQEVQGQIKQERVGECGDATPGARGSNNSRPCQYPVNILTLMD